MRDESFKVELKHEGVGFLVVGTYSDGCVDGESVAVCLAEYPYYIEGASRRVLFSEPAFRHELKRAVYAQLEAEYEGLREEAADKRRKLDE